ncbi:DUF1542 domain-containing protein [Corynebacterium felinum]|uniref:DUF1542 domain-containing protein n=1 Tax=Corynebacterium felinum TaxID=131318 RepID=A0ABU2B4T2_9CORY|nr:DUF1542 domain-containing protein [Corynebacterium felinum]MDF5820858.1 DUF1542 domain-containing protein [Corynebacterium felinum]MDR7353622.1 hypothetical protein [Corynebacterium felinum]WJY95801.1 hypothetical protein CFELI_11025 [Corynebacterium felinum]
MEGLLLVAIVVGGLIFLLSRTGGSQKKVEADSLADALAEARHWNERLGSQILTIAGTDAASTQAIADASERHTAASSQIAQAQTVRQAELARESALEGLHYMNAAREIMGLPAGPELPLLEGQRQAGKVSEQRTIMHDGHNITASPHPSAQTPNYYPGGMVAGRPVPAGWYSEPWWAGALRTGVWAAGSALIFSSLFSGMAGVAAASALTPDSLGDATGLDGAETGDLSGMSDAGGEENGFFDGLFGGGDSGDGGFFGGGDGFFGGDGFDF